MQAQSIGAHFEKHQQNNKELKAQKHAADAIQDGKPDKQQLAWSYGELQLFLQ